jgi:hypothetical protein
MLAVNGLCKDHGLEAVGLGDLVAKVRKGLGASHVAIDDILVRVHLPTSVAFKALRMAQALRLQLTYETIGEAPHTSLAREHVQLFRACVTVVIVCLFFSRGGACIDCLTEDPVASKEDGIRMYRRARKGQLGVSAEGKLMCHLPNTVPAEVINVLLFVDEIRRKISCEKYPTRWAIDL